MVWAKKRENGGVQFAPLFGQESTIRRLKSNNLVSNRNFCHAISAPCGTRKILAYRRLKPKNLDLGTNRTLCPELGTAFALS